MIARHAPAPMRRKSGRREKPAAAVPGNIGVLQDVIGFRIRRIQNRLSRTFAALIAHYKLQPGTFSSMALIAANPGISQVQLSELVGYDKASVVAIIDLLERMGWAERRRAPEDRRKHSLYLTKKGEKACLKLRDLALQNEKPVHERLTEAELKQLSQLLDKLYFGPAD